MKKLILVAIIGLFSANLFAQSGTGTIKGFIKCGGIGNDGCHVSHAKITLRPIENWSKSTNDINFESDEDGYFNQAASFGEYQLIISAEGYETYQTSVYIPSSVTLNWGVRLHKADSPKNETKGKFDGKWSFDETKNGFYLSLLVDIKQVGDKLTGEYSNVSSKESVGKILGSKIIGNTATIEIDCDWGGNGKVKLTLLKGNRLHWQVIKRDERKGEFIVLLDKILKKTN